MAEVKWIKITTNIFDDEKMKLIDVLPERDAIIVIWFKLLAMAGKTNDNGLVYVMKEMATTDEVLSTVFNRPLSTIRLALQTFQRFNMIEINDHINIINWDKHQNIEGLDKIKEQNRIRQAKYREKKKLELKSNVTSRYNNGTDIDKELDKNKKKDIDINYSYIQITWNQQEYLPKIKSLTQKRKDKIKLRIQEQGEENFITAIKKLDNSSFATGKNNRNWVANIDWLIANDTNIVKVLECKYDNKPNTQQINNDSKYDSTDTDELLAEIGGK